MDEAFIIDAVRSASGRGKVGGAFACTHPVDLLAQVVSSLIRRTGIDPVGVDDVIGGCVTQAGEQAMNVTRQAILAAGLPERVPATTVDRQCGSSQQAVHFAAQAVRSGACDVVIACGVESMSRARMWTNWLDRDPYGPAFARRYPGGLVPQGIAAELVASRGGLTRKDLDAFAAQSHERAARAWGSGWFDAEVVPVEATAADGRTRTVRADETVRAGTSVAQLAGLRPAFHDESLGGRFPEIRWQITAGNSSPLTDGAAAALIASESATRRLYLEPRARVAGMSVVGDDPLTMLTAVLPATEMVLARAGMTVGDVDLFEINEAFACVPLVWQREFSVPDERLNMAGGAIALGHPLGASGIRILATLLGNLERTGSRVGLQTMCEAGGMANALLVERL